LLDQSQEHWAIVSLVSYGRTRSLVTDGAEMDRLQDEGRWTGEIERRKAPRKAVRGRGPAQLLSLNLPVTVIQISLGGFQIRTSFVFLVDSVHVFRFQLGDGSAVDVSARVIHCLPRVTNAGAPVYVTGLAFVDSASQEAQAVAADLLESSSAILCSMEQTAL
jgi:hypothetical protein